MISSSGKGASSSTRAIATSAASSRWGALSSSTASLPEQRTRRVTDSGDSARRGSSSTGLELALGKLVEGRRRQRVAQQALGGHHHQRPPVGGEGLRLPPQQVEILRRGRWVGDEQVALGKELQEALQPRRGMLRPLSFIAVRQEKDERRLLLPLGARRRQELVDDHLRAVGEIAKLGFPEHQRLRRVDGVAILEANRRILGQRAVVDGKRRLRLR